jgi:hypothetical protein
MWNLLNIGLVAWLIAWPTIKQRRLKQGALKPA